MLSVPRYAKGERTILRTIINKRFGDLPAWADERLNQLTHKEMEELSLRLFDAKTLEELFPR